MVACSILSPHTALVLVVQLGGDFIVFCLLSFPWKAEMLISIKKNAAKARLSTQSGKK